MSLLLASQTVANSFRPSRLFALCRHHICHAYCAYLDPAATIDQNRDFDFRTQFLIYWKSISENTVVILSNPPHLFCHCKTVLYNNMNIENTISLSNKLIMCLYDDPSQYRWQWSTKNRAKAVMNLVNTIGKGLWYLLHRSSSRNHIN